MSGSCGNYSSNCSGCVVSRACSKDGTKKGAPRLPLGTACFVYIPDNPSNSSLSLGETDKHRKERIIEEERLMQSTRMQSSDTNYKSYNPSRDEREREERFMPR